MKDARQIADETKEAYSRWRYTDAGWRGVIRALLAAGAEEDEVRWILASKHMRWAADSANREHGVTSINFINYVNRYLGSVEGFVLTVRYDLAQQNLEARKGKPGAELAGFAEGEDIAALIDLARTIAHTPALAGYPSLRTTATAVLARIEARVK
jgi:hypothetical protein